MEACYFSNGFGDRALIFVFGRKKEMLMQNVWTGKRSCGVVRRTSRLAGVLTILLFVSVGWAERVYFIGNSVTDNIEYSGLETLAQSRGFTMPWGRHMIPGAPLVYIWENPEHGFEQEPYGFYSNALTNYEWDFVSFQPFDRDRAVDAATIADFVDLTLSQSSNLTVLVYARWPRDDEDFDTRWLRPLDDPLANRENAAFFEQLTRDVRANDPKHEVFMVPVGHVMYELNQRMKAGKVPGMTDIYDLYEDGIHLNSTGEYLCALTFFTTIFREDPRGLPVPAQYGTIDPAVVEVFQDTVLDIVAAQELSGVQMDLPLEVGTSVLAPAIANIGYTNNLDANFGIAPFVWSLKSGALPSGITLNSDGTISGVSSALGEYTLTVEVTDSTIPAVQTAQAELTLNVEQDTAPAITTASPLPNGFPGTPYARAFEGFSATNGNGSLSWIVVSNTLPPGLSLSSGGEISGSPQATGTWQFVVKVTDSDATPDSSQQTFSIEVLAAESTTLTARKIAADVSIDGDLFEPFWAATNVLDVVTGGSGGVLNEGAAYDVVWDSAFLYFAVTVTDSELVVNDSDPRDDDAVHICIDALHDNEAAFNLDDRQIVVGPYGRAVETAGRGDSILYASKRIAGGYSVEVAVPWENLGLLPTDGLSVGFDVVVGDDTNGIGVAGQRALGATLLSTPSPADFRDLLCTGTTDANGSHAGLMAVESFDYADDAPLDARNGGTGWAGEWQVQNDVTTLPCYQVSAGRPLAYNGVVRSPCYGLGGQSWSASGRSLNTGTAGPFAAVRDGSTGLIGADGSEVWLAFLCRRDSAASYELMLHQNAGTPWWHNNTGKVKLKVAGNNWALEAGGSTDDTGLPATVGEIFLMVFKLEYGATDTVSLFVNPVPGTVPTVPDAQVAGAADLQFCSFRWYPGSNPNQGSLDEIRVGSSYTAVVPDIGSAPQIVSQISNRIVRSGASLSLPAELSGNNLEVSWKRLGEVEFTGAVLNCSPFLNTNAGAYIVSASNRLGSVTGAVFQISVQGMTRQEWRQFYFGTTENAGDAADTAAPAGDGVANLIKYGMGFAPDEEIVLPVAGWYNLAGTNCVSIEFLHSTNANDVVVTAQGTTNLLSGWIDLVSYQADNPAFSGAGVEVLREPLEGEGGQERIGICAPDDPDSYFFRIWVSAP